MKTYCVKIKDTKILHHFSEEKFWLNANIINDFLYPWEINQFVDMQFKAQYDDQFFYFFFDVKCPLPIITYIKDNHKKEVLISDRVELFFMSGKSMKPYYCLEIDSEKRIYDYKAKYYRIVDDNWAWPKDNLLIEVVKSDIGYKTFGKITLKSLNDLKIIQDNEMTIGIYRGHCISNVEESAHLKWISWIKPKSDVADFHIPSSFGKFILE